MAPRLERQPSASHVQLVRLPDTKRAAAACTLLSDVAAVHSLLSAFLAKRAREEDSDSEVEEYHCRRTEAFSTDRPLKTTERRTEHEDSDSERKREAKSDKSGDNSERKGVAKLDKSGDDSEKQEPKSDKSGDDSEKRGEIGQIGGQFGEEERGEIR